MSEAALCSRVARPHLTAKAVCWLLLFVFATLPLRGNANETPSAEALHQLRVQFKEARQALKKENFKRFSELAPQLKDYPLYPYLSYWHMKAKLREQPEATVHAFLKLYADTPLADLLRRDWLKHLAREGRWKTFIDFYQPSNNTSLQCHYHSAQLHTGKTNKAWKGARKLWLVGHSQPDSCNKLFAAWEKAGGISDKLRMQRIEKALWNGNVSLARYLVKPMPKWAHDKVALWKKIRNNPSRVGSETALQKDNETNRIITFYGLMRLARSEPEKAAELWGKLKSRYRFSKSQRNELHKKIAMNLAYDGKPEAQQWLGTLPKKSLDKKAMNWAVRAALRQGNWDDAEAWIARMPVRERNNETWRYWQARIHQQKGEQDSAEHLFHQVSNERSYYGFLAADRIGSDYNLTHKPVQSSQEKVEAIKKLPAMVRAYELYHLLLTNDARREWEYAVTRMNRSQRLAAGKLADEWQWYDRALLTLARANYFDDLEIRFPLAHNATFSAEASNRELDPAWVYAVARQESAMISDVRSSAGAIGLMQLMPSTGKEIAKKLKVKFRRNRLLKPDTNIRFGAFYLREVMNRFDNNAVMATAAYNAGPHRVEKWAPQEQEMDADIWVESIPFHETRGYVRRVMAYTVFYDQRLDGSIKRISERMPDVVIARPNSL